MNQQLDGAWKEILAVIQRYALDTEGLKELQRYLGYRIEIWEQPELSPEMRDALLLARLTKPKPNPNN